MHAATQRESMWTRFGYADRIMDNLIAAGQAKEMIIVMPNTGTASGGDEHLDLVVRYMLEFIQRRGRVLRSAPGKYSAAVHDLLVVPATSSEESSGSMTHSILRTELSRARQFATYCRNTATKTELDMIAAEAGMAPFVAAEENYEEEDGGDV